MNNVRLKWYLIFKIRQYRRTFCTIFLKKHWKIRRMNRPSEISLPLFEIIINDKKKKKKMNEWINEKCNMYRRLTLTIVSVDFFLDNEKISDRGLGAWRRRVRVRGFLGRSQMERQICCAKRIETQTAIRLHAHRTHGSDQTDWLATRISLLVSDVQDGREERNAVHHGTFD